MLVKIKKYAIMFIILASATCALNILLAKPARLDYYAVAKKIRHY